MDVVHILPAPLLGIAPRDILMCPGHVYWSFSHSVVCYGEKKNRTIDRKMYILNTDIFIK